MSETKIIRESLENWQGGKANGYFEPYTNTIHILKPEEMYRKILAHENVHVERQNKTTFKLAAIITILPVRNFLFGLLMLLAVVALFSSMVPFLFSASVFTVPIFCHVYEEAQADHITSKSIKEIGVNGA